MSLWEATITSEVQKLTYFADVHAERRGVFPDHTLGIPYHLSTIPSLDVEWSFTINVEDFKEIRNEDKLHRAIRDNLREVGRSLVEGAWFLEHYAQSLAHYSKCEYVIDTWEVGHDFSERCRLFAEAFGCRMGNDVTTAADLLVLAPWHWPVKESMLPYWNMGQEVLEQCKALRQYLTSHFRRPFRGDVDVGIRIDRENIDSVVEPTVEFPARRYSSAYTKANEVYEEAQRLVPQHEYGMSLMFQANHWKQPAPPALNRGITMVGAVLALIRLGVGSRNIDFMGFVSRLRHELDDKSWDYFKPFLRSFWTYAVDNFQELHLNGVGSEEAREVLEAIAQGGSPHDTGLVETSATSTGNDIVAQESTQDEETEEETEKSGRVPKVFGCETMKGCKSAKLCEAFPDPVGVNDKGVYSLRYHKGKKRAYDRGLDTSRRRLRNWKLENVENSRLKK